MKAPPDPEAQKNAKERLLKLLNKEKERNASLKSRIAFLQGELLALPEVNEHLKLRLKDQ